jgi:ubiquinone/menaquinone biosynthesis C-methylase UbiE
MLQWVDDDLSFIRHRYNQIARFFVFFEWLFLLPPGIRRKAVDRLELKSGDRVLEVGRGTGRNLSLLREAVGPEGHIYGVDLSDGMLAEAQRLCVQKKWNSVTLIQSDAAQDLVPEPVDGVLFSLSYNTMPHHREVLGHAWNQLGRGNYLVIMNAKLPLGLRSKLLLPYSVWIMKLTVLGNPYIHPWEELHELINNFEIEELLWGYYYICRGRKPR